MNITLISLNFIPEKVGISKYSYSLARSLASSGHRVSVITTYPYYPYWHQRSSRRYLFSRTRLHGINIYRVPVWIPSSPSGLRRVLHLLSFSLTACIPLFFHIPTPCNLIISVAPSFLSSPLAVLYRLVNSSTILHLHIQDFELQAAQSLNILSLSFLGGLLKQLEQAVLKSFDSLSTISPSMINQLLSKGVDQHRTYLLPNPVNISQYNPRPRLSTNYFLHLLGIPPDAVVVLYSGSMNSKQDFPLLVRAVKSLNRLPDLFWVFCGHGSSREFLISQTLPFSNVRHLPLQPESLFPELLNFADIHVIPQREGTSSLLFPSKLFPIYASSRPVVVTAEPNSDLESIASHGGICVPPGNHALFADAISFLCNHKSERLRLGQQGYQLVQQQYDQRVIYKNFESHISQLAINCIS